MKKYAAIILCLVAMLVIGTLSVSAATEQRNGYWIIDAENADEILSQKAGEGEIAWEVPYIRIQPTIDGVIEKTEYASFELYEDYLSWMAPVGDDASGTTEEEFMEFYESTQTDFFDVYWGWDGAYMYLAFEIKCLNGFSCTPEKMGGDVYLFAYNCLQVGIADVDTVGKTADYKEMGFGVHSETNDDKGVKEGDPITFAWSGNYIPEAGVDFMGIYDAENQMLTYECRFQLQKALGLTDRTVENGDEINFAWLLAVNGQAQTTNETWQLGFCHGIGGPYSGKQPEYFARVTFTGKPDDVYVPTIDIDQMSEEEKQYELIEHIDLSKENVAKTFIGENAGTEYITEGEEAFLRITSLATDGNYAYAYSQAYPKNLLGAWGPYIIVKYRTSSPVGEDLGLIYRTQNMTEHDVENCYAETIGHDGEWHIAYFDMSTEANWVHYIINMGFVLFPFADSTAGETIDIAFVKAYRFDPFDLYADDIYYDNGQSDDEDTTAAEDESADPDDTADVIEETTATTADETAAPTEETTHGGDDPDTADKGCASTLGLLTLVALLPAAFIIGKKKED